MAIGYLIREREGSNADVINLESDLKEMYPDLVIGDSRQVGKTIIKAYGYLEDMHLYGRIDVSYRADETAAKVIGEMEKTIAEKISTISSLEWMIQH